MGTSGKKYSKTKALTAREIPLGICVIILVLLIIFCPECVGNPIKLINAGTLITLTGLLLTTTGIKESGKLNHISRKILAKAHDERKLALTLVGISALLSMILTNDIALFIIIPLTVNLQNLVENDLSKLIILETIAVNAGSSLTPMGNPQNIYLWRLHDIPFFAFITAMLPIVFIMALLLWGLTLILFRKTPVNPSKSSKIIPQDKRLFTLSFALLLLFIASVELNIHSEALIIIFIIYIIFYRKVIIKTDWLLLVLFAVIFIDFGAITKIPAISETINRSDLHKSGNLFLISAGLSQIISNVPATVFISKFSENWKVISYGANIGGNGIIIGSLANIISARLAKNSRFWIDFHKYSIPYFILSATIVYIIFFTAIL